MRRLVPSVALLAIACTGAADRGSPGVESGIATLDDAETHGSGDDDLGDGVDANGDKLDVGPGGSTAGGAGDCMSGGSMGDAEFSLIWIANSPQGTVSKIDTRSGEELARYYTGPSDGDDDPSRTSVNLFGDVAVANRAGGLTKFAAQLDDCVDADGDGTITTSTGSDDVRPFGTDECMLRHVALPYPPDEDNAQGPRPTAWDAGAGHDPCEVSDDRVWSGWWIAEESTAQFRRFDGATGDVLDEVVVPDYQPGQDYGYGPYGGAVDGAGNFWVTGLYGPLLRIDAETLDVEIWEMPAESGAYGIAVDADGHVWSAGESSGVLTHFDPDTETFEVYPTPNGSLRGLQIDREGQLWAAGNLPCALVRFDLASRTIVQGAIALPGCDTPVGVSIDVEGFVWLPDQWADLAYKVHPTTYETSTTTGLVGPYTYSDMTGAGLGLVVDPPQG